MMTRSAVVSTADCVGDEITSKAKCSIHPQAKCLTVCKHSHVLLPQRRLFNRAAAILMKLFERFQKLK